jgi:hypothetical protein
VTTPGTVVAYRGGGRRNKICVPLWKAAECDVTRTAATFDPALNFPVDHQHALTNQVERESDKGGYITCLTSDGIDHMGTARKFFHIKAARDWLFRQTKS